MYIYQLLELMIYLLTLTRCAYYWITFEHNILFVVNDEYWNVAYLLNYIRTYWAMSYIGTRHTPEHCIPFELPYIGNFLRKEILAKMTVWRCVKFSLSPIIAISRTLIEDVKYGLFFAVSIFGDFREVANSAKIKHAKNSRYTVYLIWLTFWAISESFWPSFSWASPTLATKSLTVSHNTL